MELQFCSYGELVHHLMLLMLLDLFNSRVLIESIVMSLYMYVIWKALSELEYVFPLFILDLCLHVLRFIEINLWKLMVHFISFQAY